MSKKTEEIIGKFEEYKGDIKQKLFWLTPENAKELLELNDSHNRNPKKKSVKRYSEMMASGDFLLSNDSIALTKSDRMINGGHRATALSMLDLMECCEEVVKRGKKMLFSVMWNLPDETKDIINNNEKVTNKDRQYMFLEEHGLKGKDIWGTICEILSAMTDGKKKKDAFTQDVKAVRKFATDSNNFKALQRISSRDYVKKNRKGYQHFGITSTTVAMRMEFLLTMIAGTPDDRKLALQFFNDMDSMNLPHGSPVGLLRNWCLDYAHSHVAGHGNEATEIAIMMAFDAYKKWNRTGKYNLKKIDVMVPILDRHGNQKYDELGKPMKELNKEFYYRNYVK